MTTEQAADERLLTLTTDEGKAARFRQRKAWFLAEVGRQYANRAMMARCEAMYDGEQYDGKDAEKIRARGQNPVVYNEIKPTIDWLIGTERRTRTDFVVFARDDDNKAAIESAEVKTKLLKYLSDVNRTPFEQSMVADDKFKAGVGWKEIGVQEPEEEGEEMIYERRESWRNIIHDSFSTRFAMQDDARYQFRVKAIDLDLAKAIFKDKTKELEIAAFDGDAPINHAWLGSGGLDMTNLMAQVIGNHDASDGISLGDGYNPRRRVLLIECWSREYQRNAAGLLAKKIRVTIMTEQDTILEEWSPYKHGRLPFIPDVAYVNKRTGMPYGPIHQLIGPQEALNHRMTKALAEASITKIMLEAGAVDPEVMTIQEIADEIQDPTGVPVFANGALAGGKVQMHRGLDNAQGQLALADRDSMHIRAMSGVQKENMGQIGQSQSGKAIIAQAENGGMLTTELFDNALLHRQLCGEMKLSLIEQFYTSEKKFSIAGERGKRDFVKLNTWDGTRFVNDIAACKAMFVIGEHQWKQAIAHAAFEQAMAMISQIAPVAPQAAVALLPHIFEWADLPNKQTIVGEIRRSLGLPDPDAEPTPEEAAAQQKNAQQQQALADASFQAQMATLIGQVEELKAKIGEIKAKATDKKLDSQYKAAQAAQVLALAPQIAPVADELLASAGYQDMGGEPGVGMPQQLPPEQAQPMPGPLVGHEAGIETPQADGLQGAPQ